MKVSNPSNLPTVDYRQVKPLQGDLKDLTKENYAKLKRALETDGFIVPLFLWKRGDTHYLIDGHQRHRVLTQENLQPYELPYIEIEATDEADAKKKLLRISSQYGTITQEGYDTFAADLPESELVETVNFDALRWDNEPEVEEDEPPEVSKEPAKSKLGEIYQLGRHRLMCGDANTDIPELMDGIEPLLVFTDPPYGIDAEKMTLGTGKREFHRGNWDSHRPEIDKIISWAEWKCVWGGNYFTDILPPTNDWLCWHKKNDNLSFSEFELAWTNFGKNTRLISHHWSGEEKAHPTQKPLGVCAWAIKMVDVGTVLDPFGGSGSTLIACEELDRTCYTMELDPKYVDVIRKRYHKLVNDDNEEGWEAGTPKISDKAEKGHGEPQSTIRESQAV